MKLNPAATYWQKSSSCGVSGCRGLFFCSASASALAPACLIWLSVLKFLASASSGARRAGLPPRFRNGTTLASLVMLWYSLSLVWCMLFFGGYHILVVLQVVCVVFSV